MFALDLPSRTAPPGPALPPPARWSVHCATVAAEASAESGSALRLAVLRLSRRLRQESAGDTDVTPSQMSALSVLYKHGQMNLGELASVERIAPPSMTRIAARLEEKGYLERRADHSDRRVALVAITSSGRDLLRQREERGDAFVKARLASLSAEEREALSRAVPILEKLARADEEHGPGGSAHPVRSDP
jgi:DNA-binding MarR family transcriptional regulator